MPRSPRPRTIRPPQATIPDRGLEPESTLPSVAIRAAGAHPFVFRKMVIGPVGASLPNPGDMVRAVDREGRHLGYGLWNPRSQISLRILARDDEPPGPAFWDHKIAQAVDLRVKTLGLNEQTNAYRVLHAEGDGLSGLIADRFDDVLSVEVFSLGIYQRIGPIVELCAGRLGTKHFRVHVDERVALQEDFPGRLLASPQLPPRITIEEHGIRYRIHFEEGHKTGFFCDQRDNRRDLARFCAGQSVLDACCYTGGFGLNAMIRGQAREVTCVDLDEKAVALARENGNANSVRLSVVHADAFGYMRQMALNQRTFGVVVLDPPKLIIDRDEVS
ncbi:MAG TPA: class I SAM-dependent methyltransferase, partial [Isosphaeraceae bacterium]|nr:class I SAM-dependent methyltransferase [Isosphaeraceae bacterium]